MCIKIFRINQIAFPFKSGYMQSCSLRDSGNIKRKQFVTLRDSFPVLRPRLLILESWLVSRLMLMHLSMIWKYFSDFPARVAFWEPSKCSHFKHPPRPFWKSAIFPTKSNWIKYWQIEDTVCVMKVLLMTRKVIVNALFMVAAIVRLR